MKEIATASKDGSADERTLQGEHGLIQILAPTDFSPRSATAVDYAAKLARRLNAQVTLLHVVPEPSALDYTIGGIPDGQWEQVRQQADKKLEEALALAKRSYESVDTLVRTGVDLRDEIVSAAREVSADLVVLSTHGYTGWKHFLFGSDAEELLREIPCSVLVVR